MGRAIDLLPPEIGSFFQTHRGELLLRVNDPDLWRVAGWDEAHHHFLDFGAAPFGRFPFLALPRDYEAALTKFGASTLHEYGELPWRTAEMADKVRDAFGRIRSRASFAESDLVLFSSAAAHYLQDAHQPLHAHINYDGQQTGQRGVHARFESALFERFEQRLTVRSGTPWPIVDIRGATFEVLLDSYQLVPGLLEADRMARRGRVGYDDEYFEDFFIRAKPLLERRLGDAITATVGMILGAWNQAGQPRVGPRQGLAIARRPTELADGTFSRTSRP
jgi:hypothetical protein